MQNGVGGIHGGHRSGGAGQIGPNPNITALTQKLKDLGASFDGVQSKIDEAKNLIDKANGEAFGMNLDGATQALDKISDGIAQFKGVFDNLS